MSSETNQWLYDTTAQLFDLTRRRLSPSPPSSLTIPSPRSLHHRGLIIDPSRTVLIIIDMQNFFLSPLIHSHPAGLSTIKPLTRIIPRCRSLQIPVCWLNWGLDEASLASLPPAVSRGFCPTRAANDGCGWHFGLGAPLPSNQGRTLFKGTWNADIYSPLRPYVDPSDQIFHKARMSGLWRESELLHQYLRSSGAKTLLFAGVNTDQCVLGTLTDACNWGWDCVLLRDCCGTMTEGNAGALAEYQVERNLGFVVGSEEFLGAEVVG
ncbi:Isochorismatase hydrolase [Patellaria atrata CBS 101060]|uniref:Isochorismatase hydrolase n=1 Tax=Patellaria atrata CBS 101060 TaxID=1346257 RepID=A0A9P4VKF4_9PEZI|nr:Isochorismatase hydrolase [Patellaria atrata CBS 101060]